MAIAAVGALAEAARAESWCAEPVVVHEWGVHVYGGDRQPLPVVDLPAWFHSAAQPSPTLTPVRGLPADNGVRFLPVMHFYGGAGFSMPIPLGLEVGFSGGPPSFWYPAVDALRPTAKRQLAWDRLALSTKPQGAPRATDIDWVMRARGLEALWVERQSEAERFVFYEAATREAEPLVLRRGETWTPQRRHIIVDNRGSFPVHDVFFVHREAANVYVFEIPSIPAGRSAGFIIEDHPLAARGSPVEHLRAQLTAPEGADGKGWRAGGDCVMGRDPAVPFEVASGHRLFRAEVDLVLGVWSKAFFEQAGTTVLYREDTKQLDAVMPLSIYTDMYHYIELHRAGLALWQNVRLP